MPYFSFSHSTRLLAATTLRNVLGTKNLAEILSERETISQVMQNALDEATDPWGVKVRTRLEVESGKSAHVLMSSLFLPAGRTCGNVRWLLLLLLLRTIIIVVVAERRKQLLVEKRWMPLLLWFFVCRKDVRLPVQLQRAMAAEAEAAREARAKVKLIKKTYLSIFFPTHFFL